MERLHGRPQLELEPALRVIEAFGSVSQDFQPAANGLSLLGGTEGPTHCIRILLEGQLVRVHLTHVGEPRLMPADNTLGAALKPGLADRFAPRDIDGTRELLDLGTVGLGQVPLGVALLWHRAELNFGANVHRPAEPQQSREGLPDHRRHPLATVRNQADLALQYHRYGRRSKLRFQSMGCQVSQ